MKWLGRVTLAGLMTAAVGVVWVAWASSGTQVVTSQTTAWGGVVGAAGLLLAVGTSTAQGVAGYRRRLAARPDVAGHVRFAPKGRLPPAGAVDVTGLGAKPPIGSGQTPYVARDVDESVDALITAGGMLVLTGPAAAGKSRLAAEAIHRTAATSERRVLVPVRTASLRALAGAGYRFTDAIIVLDDLEHFLGDGGLDTALLGAVCAHPSTAVVATIRADVLSDVEKVLSADLSDRAGLTLYRPGADLLRSLRREGRIIAVGPDLSATEEARAEAVGVREGDRRIAEAVASAAGFGEYLIAGPAQMERWTRQSGDALEAVGQAVVTAAVDARRAGFDDPLPAHVLDQLTPAYVPARFKDRATTPAPAAGRAWAAQTITGTTASSCLTPHTDGTYTAADYLTDRADQPPSPLSGRPVPESTWTILQTHATPAQATAIGLAAHSRQRPDIAFTVIAHAAGHGHTRAMYNLGVLLQERGDLAEAETWWRRAAHERHPEAMFNLGVLLGRRGDLAEAESWFREAADEQPEAMNSLGVLLKERGDLAEAETWWRRAADERDPEAMFNLGLLHEDREADVEAENWYRQAVEEGHVGAGNNLGILLHQRGEGTEVEAWWREAAREGDTNGLNNLAILLYQRGEETGAETCWREAAEEGHAIAMFNLGVLFHQRGDLAEAETWYRKAAQDGHTDARLKLEALLKRHGNNAETGDGEAAGDSASKK